MKTRGIAILLAAFAAALMILGYPVSSDAGNSILDRATNVNGGGKTRSEIAAPSAHDQRIGGVTRTQASVEGVIHVRARDLSRDLPVYQNEEVTTGTNARAVLRFNDGSVLTIGAEAEVVLDKFVYGNSGGVITLLKGALRFTSGKMGRPGLLIKMPTATIGIRGTDFWAGEMQGGHGIMLLHGEVDVFNPAGKVTLGKAYEGTVIAGADEAPGTPTIWGESQQKKALAGLSFTSSPLCAML